MITVRNARGEKECDVSALLLIERKLLKDALACATTRFAIEAITRESYANPDTILNQAYKRNDTVYLGFVDDVLVGFFMTGWEVCQNGSKEDSLVYVGLTAIRETFKSKGVGRQLFDAFLKDGLVWQSQRTSVLFFWFTTASPSFAHCWWSMPVEISPQRNGELDPSLQELGRKIRDSFQLDIYASGSFDFVLRGCTKVRYALDEMLRVRQMIREEPRSLFSVHRVDETNGDRLMFVGKMLSSPGDRAH